VIDRGMAVVSRRDAAGRWNDMLRQIVAVGAVLLAAVVSGSNLSPGHPGSVGASQASPAEADCPATTPEENEALVQRYYYEAYNARNTAVIDELLADDFVRHNVAVPQANQEPNNADDVARVEAWLAAFSDLQVTIEAVFATEETVVSFSVWSGTQDGPLPQWDSPVTGLPMERESLVVWRVTCGQLAENWIVQDNLTMLRQLGIVSDEELTTAGTPTP
jgi:predicted ester cyclase